MIRFTKSRPLSLGTVSTEYFDTYSELEPKLERLMERLADRGYNLSELTGSNSKQGTIEVTHDAEADVTLYSWETVDSAE